jgi:hypothetical protein
MTSSFCNAELVKPPGNFRARHIVPLFANAPEWVVEHKDPHDKRITHLAWCRTEFHARLITNALNGD